eukprot:5294496-Lingulodinium_polyedra.AAC.1
MSVFIPNQIEKGQCPPWLREACRYREVFTDCVLVWEPHGLGGGEECVFFLYACQSPFYAMFLPLQKQQTVMPVGGSSS